MSWNIDVYGVPINLGGKITEARVRYNIAVKEKAFQNENRLLTMNDFGRLDTRKIVFENIHMECDKCGTWTVRCDREEKSKSIGILPKGARDFAVR